VGIVLPVAVIHKDLPAPVDLRLVAVESDSEPTAFNLFNERPGARLDTWPGKNAMGTLLIGRMPLADGAGTVCIVANHEPIEPSSINSRSAERRGPRLNARVGRPWVALHDGDRSNA
jgi:hypothetical protein